MTSGFILKTCIISYGVVRVNFAGYTCPVFLFPFCSNFANSNFGTFEAFVLFFYYCLYL